ncbi:MAG: SDR family NAD(P)-dependent oxidoreductase [Pseudomonadales bacterium]
MSDSEMKGKVGLVTGGTKGIGFGTAKLMCEAGMRVIVTGRNEERGQDAESRLREAGDARYLQHDTASTESWQQAMDTVTNDYGALNVLVNNAGIYLNKPVADTSMDEFDRMMSVNFRGIFIGIQAALPLMRDTAKDGSSGSIVNVSSDASVRAYALQSIYNCSKGALDVLTRSLGREFGELGYNIRVNGVNPYFIVSEMTDKLFENVIEQGAHTNREALLECNKAPIGRVGYPEDVGQMILFLASEKAGFISGTNTLVDGAATIGPGEI